MNYNLYLGDCLEVLPTIPIASIDAIISDPPYPGIKRSYGYFSESDWLAMMQQVIKESRRILKPDGSAVFILQPNSEKVGRMRTWFYKFLAWCSEEWNIIQDMWWWNPAAMPSVHAHRTNGLARCSVKACLWLGSPDSYRNQEAVLWTESQRNAARRAVARADLTYSPSGWARRDSRLTQAAVERGGVTPFNLLPIANTDSQSSAGANGHGAGTPLALADWWTRYITRRGETVLDMFAGTSTMGIAALKRGRNYVGIERMASYIEVSQQRLEQLDTSQVVMNL